MSVEIETIFRSRARNRGIVLSALRLCAAALRGYFRRRATARALANLSEEELRDIGLARTETGYRQIHRDRYGAHYW
ncbi:DUF1127 domain-containing protein [Roseibium salinum]|uniref:DUF1127 domain-containing protein n=1 Tax=Roseibium salinum TaxID=1604349 RepID=A0ABT3R4Z6_9HYPH|nr:DUF1127 domain-containing protein [Roseibium sp. DSM 29163]MCX2724264.1 DUF1127 domain-containing protein [Roseibium sp. DSM 29163]MDN3721680.1 DUF1127 domain-containing protein [Roseibium salinum]